MRCLFSRYTYVHIEFHNIIHVIFIILPIDNAHVFNIIYTSLQLTRRKRFERSSYCQYCDIIKKNNNPQYAVYPNNSRNNIRKIQFTFFL